ncbi:MAG TPA: hypothetical protein VIO94_00540 [Phenylobacterium sp.]
MNETQVRVKPWRNCWSVECWGLQHALYFSQEKAVEAGARVVRGLIARGEEARLVVEEPLNTRRGEIGQDHAA